MAYAEFTGELDAPAGGFVPFEGELDKEPGIIDKMTGELGQLRDEFFTGVDSAVAGVKTLNAGIQMRRLQETEAAATRLEERGQSLYARQMRS